MTTLAVLTSPSANRVYAKEAPRLVLAELALVEPRLEGSLGARSVRVVGGVAYLWVDDAEGLTEDDDFVLSNLSSTYALFEVREDGRALVPRELRALAFYDSDLISIQRYTGKTNEQFTHLLVNVALAASSAAQERAARGQPVRLLDPLAGRGTTLNRGLVYGFDVAGIETDARDVQAYKGFLTTYLRDHGRRFALEESSIRKGPLAGTKRFGLRIEGSQGVEMVKGDATRAAEYFGARSFDVLVADLPYGVHHGSAAAGALSRSPEALLAAALGGWHTVLRSGAGLSLSWNLRTCGRAVVEGLLAAAGFEVADAAALEHRVDRTVTRGVAVARK